MPIVNRISAYHDDMKDWRHDIHKHPELAYEEKRTAGQVVKLLKSFGIEDIAEGIGGTGVVAVIRNGDGPSVGLREDMDALPINEETGVEYSSVYGVHNMPGAPLGEIQVSSGPVMAAADQFSVIVKGRGGHGAIPHKAVDPIVVSSLMVSSLQSLVSRETDPHSTLVISVTKIHGGDAFNVIPDSVSFGGTVRYFDTDLGKNNQKRMKQMLDGIASAHNVDIDFSYENGYPPTINHEKEAKFAREIAADVTGQESSKQIQTMGPYHKKCTRFPFLC